MRQLDQQGIRQLEQNLQKLINRMAQLKTQHDDSQSVVKYLKASCRQLIDRNKVISVQLVQMVKQIKADIL